MLFRNFRFGSRATFTLRICQTYLFPESQPNCSHALALCAETSEHAVTAQFTGALKGRITGPITDAPLRTRDRSSHPPEADDTLEPGGLQRHRLSIPNKGYVGLGGRSEAI